MYQGKKILAIIPARGGSKRVPKKNIKILGNHPLIAYTILAAADSVYIDEVVVSSDCDEILNTAKKYPCTIQKRPKEFAEDNTTTAETLRYVIDNIEKSYDLIVVLQPTSPFRKTKEIDLCIKELIDNDLDSTQTVMGVSDDPALMFVEEDFANKEAFFDKTKRKQHYILNGAVYVVKKDVFIESGKLYGEKNKPLIMDKENSLDIDTFDDWEKAEKIISNHHNDNGNGNGEGDISINKNLKIGNKKIGASCATYIIAEIGVNHNGDLSLAKKMIDEAVDAGADAVKFQTFNAKTGTSKVAPKTTYQKENDGDEGNYQTMLQKLQLSEEQFQEIKKYCDDKNITFLSTASDHESLKVLEKLNPPAYKIGSPHITNIPLLKDTAKLNKPIIIATGMATYEEIDDAIKACKEVGNGQIILLHCVSDYPTQFEDVNLNVIKSLQKKYPQCLIGFSDHTVGIEASTAAVSLGACMVERHFTSDKTMPGPDHKASLTPIELSALVKSVRNIDLAMGDGVKRRTLREEEVARIARRSVVAHVNIPKGTIITEKMLRLKKPGTGIKPKYYWDVIGKIAKKDIEEDFPLQWEWLDDYKNND